MTEEEWQVLAAADRIRQAERLGPPLRTRTKRIIGVRTSTMAHPVLGLLYVLEALGTDTIKVGYTSGDVEARRFAQQMGSAAELVVLATTPGTKRDEYNLHQELKEFRIRGEWFHKDPALDHVLQKFCPDKDNRLAVPERA